MSDNMEDKEDVPCLLYFSGKQADWCIWSQKFNARAMIKNYLQIITGMVKAPPTSIPGIFKTLEEMKERLKKIQEFEFGNNVGYSELVSSVFDDIHFCIVDEAKTDEQPDGDLLMA